MLERLLDLALRSSHSPSCARRPHYIDVFSLRVEQNELDSIPFPVKIVDGNESISETSSFLPMYTQFIAAGARNALDWAVGGNLVAVVVSPYLPIPGSSSTMRFGVRFLHLQGASWSRCETETRASVSSGSTVSSITGGPSQMP